MSFLVFVAAAIIGKAPAARQVAIQEAPEPWFHEPEHSQVLRAIDARVAKEGPSAIISDKTFNSFDFEAKFIYVMTSGDVPPAKAPPDGADTNDGIPGELLPCEVEGGYTWSHRQRAFLRNNRDRVVRRLHQLLKEGEDLETSVCSAVVYLGAYEMIPDMMQTMQQSGANRVCSVSMILMSQGKFGPFMKTAIYRGLYSRRANPGNYVPDSPSNERLILKLAMDYYRSKAK